MSNIYILSVVNVYECTIRDELRVVTRNKDPESETCYTEKKWLVKRTKNPEPDTYQPEKNRTEKRNRNPESVTGKNRIEKKKEP